MITDWIYAHYPLLIIDFPPLDLLTSILYLLQKIYFEFTCSPVDFIRSPPSPGRVWPSCLFARQCFQPDGAAPAGVFLGHPMMNTGQSFWANMKLGFQKVQKAQPAWCITTVPRPTVPRGLDLQKLCGVGSTDCKIFLP